MKNDKLRELVLANCPQAPTWTALRSLGKSRLLQLTVLAPAIGALILFNESFVHWIRLSAEILGMDVEDAKKATLWHLQFVYLGLIGIGVASFHFALICPPSIKAAASRERWIDGELPYLSQPMRLFRFRSLAVMMNRYLPMRTRSAAAPNDLRAKYLTVVDHLVLTSGWVDPPNAADKIIRPDGRVAAQNAARALASVDPAWRPFQDACESRLDSVPIDLLALHHGLEDHSRPVERLCISLMYGIGIFTLALPSLTTAARVIWIIYAQRV